MDAHAQLIEDIQLAYSRGTVRLLRANSGTGWNGKIMQRTPDQIILNHYHAIKLMPAGVGDLIGFAGSRFCSFEAKTGTGRLTTEQENWGHLVIQCGGIFGVVRSVEDVGITLRKFGVEL